MNFLAPAAFVFLAAIPVVIVFYLLKRKRVVKLVPSTLLWQRFLAETQASAPFQKLRKNWLLLLQILLLLLAVFALSRPYFAAKQKPAELRVLILDASASMQAADVSPSRFEVARADALKWVDNLSGSDQMVIIQAGVNTVVRQSATSDKAALRRAIEECVCGDGPTRFSTALRTAESLIRVGPALERAETAPGAQRSAEIHIFSDGAIPDLKEFENKGLPLVYHRTGRSADNAGITALDVRANPENPRERAVFAGLANFSSNTVQSAVELLLDGRLVETRPVTLPAGRTTPEVFVAPQNRDGIFTARLTAQDALAADNQASAVSLLPKPVRVLLVTRGNRLLEKALRAAPAIDLSVAASLVDSAADFDAVVLDNVVPAAWPAGNVLAIHVWNPAWFAAPAPLESPPIVDWKSSHPLLRYVGFDDVRVAASLAVKAPDWAVSLADAPQASLMLAGERERQRIVWIGFDLLESNWPLRVSFPIFIVNAVEWLNPANTRGGQFAVKAGEPFRFLLARPVPEARVTLPGGVAREMRLDAGATEFVFADTSKQGVYHVKAGTNEFDFCVNLLDAGESDIRPHDELELGQYTKIGATSMRSANMEVWRTIAIIAIIVLLGEWWYYHRRTI